MIQRLQTVYLALVIILSFVGLISNIGEYFVEGSVVASFSNFGFNAEGAFKILESAGPYCLGILLIIVIFLSTISIMLFRKRMRQLRLTIISTILLVGYVATYFFFAWLYQGKLELVQQTAEITFHVRLIGIFPVLSIILNILAIIGIRKDEALVRSLDRLR